MTRKPKPKKRKPREWCWVIVQKGRIFSYKTRKEARECRFYDSDEIIRVREVLR